MLPSLSFSAMHLVHVTRARVTNSIEVVHVSVSRVMVLVEKEIRDVRQKRFVVSYPIEMVHVPLAPVMILKGEEEGVLQSIGMNEPATTYPMDLVHVSLDVVPSTLHRVVVVAYNVRIVHLELARIGLELLPLLRRLHHCRCHVHHLMMNNVRRLMMRNMDRLMMMRHVRRLMMVHGVRRLMLHRKRRRRSIRHSRCGSSHGTQRGLHRRYSWSRHCIPALVAKPAQ